MLNLDTHILLFAIAEMLTPRESALLRRNQWSISAMTLWEIAKLRERARIDLDLDNPKLMRALTRVHVWPITYEVCREIGRLDFESDPADELIAATSLLHRVPLLTRDKVLRKSKVVPLAR